MFNATFNNMSVCSLRSMNSSNNRKGDVNTDNVGSYNSKSNQVIIVFDINCLTSLLDICGLNISNCEKKV